MKRASLAPFFLTLALFAVSHVSPNSLSASSDDRAAARQDSRLVAPHAATATVGSSLMDALKARVRPAGAILAQHIKPMPPTANFTVTNTNDSGAGSLRQAILDANASPGNAGISFSIGSGAQSIALASPLPAITNTVLLFGDTQPGYSGTPLIELNGASAGAGANGLVISAANSYVQKLIINRFAGSGIVVNAAAANTTIRGNYIGTDASGSSAQANGGDGITVSSSSNTIGGNANDTNIIAFNGDRGIEITSGTGNTIVGNSIHSNASLGIDLGGDGVTANDLNDGDTGANNLQNFPVLTAAVKSGGTLIIQGLLNSTPSSNFSLQIFVNNACDPSGNGEGQTLISTASATTGTGGTGNFMISFPSSVTAGQYLTATALSPTNGTSEFSACIQVVTTQTTFVVNAATDTGDSDTSDGICNDGFGNCTLRAAMQQANASAGANVINFNIGGGGARTIAPSSDLPTVSGPLTIDGTTQPGYAGAPLIELNGTNSLGNALHVTAGSSTIRGLVINRFTSSGIVLETNGGNTVESSYIGTDASGANALGNGQYGVFIHGVANNTIGGATAGAGNLISGNSNSGIGITGAGATGNLIQGNRIGTDAAGTTALGNNQDGITINTATGNQIGGTTAGARNVVAGNTLYGINLVSASSTIIQGNYISLDASGAVSMQNGWAGVFVGSSQNCLIGGTSAGARNVISGGNSFAALWIDGASSSSNTVQGNYIGPTAAGGGGVSNAYGVWITSAPNNTIGGTAAGAGNLISGNEGGPGVDIEGSTASGNVVAGNLIGTNPAGTAAVGNGGGVFIGGAPNNIIGGTTASARNIISGNVTGLQINGSSATGNLVQGNYIGTDITGNADLGNVYGVWVQGINNTIGGTAAGAGNVISGNDFGGLRLSDGATGNLVQGNLIGTNAAGTSPLGNTMEGVLLGNSSTANTVGGTAAGAGNVIANSSLAGVRITAGTGHTVLGNSIYGNGGIGIDLGYIGVTPNDPGDGDTGVNNLQNFPVLDLAAPSGGSTNIQGSLNSTANTTFRIEFFSQPTCDSSGNGEGQTYLGFTSVTTNASGDATFNVTLGSVPMTYALTATATDPAGNTSEFSACRLVCSTLTLQPAGLPNGKRDAGYNQTITASGGSAPYTFALTAGALPAGLSLDSSGLMSGTPTGFDSATFTVTATDANGCTGSRSYTMMIDTGWSPTGALNNARRQHSATLLQNGKLLVVGGMAGGGALASVELYDAGGVWSNAASLTVARASHTATLLPNGKVLIAGGNNSGSALNSAILFDPTTETWSNTGNMITARASHTATLLPNGKVLVAGGAGGSSLASAEVYDPTTGSWSPAGNLNTARASHTATLLANGRVLVAGGASGATVLSSAELYDPTTGLWSGTGAMSASRRQQTTTLMVDGRALAVAGEDGSATLSSAEVYDPTTGVWTSAGTLNTGRRLHSATLLPNGKLLVAGGADNASAPLGSAEVYNPATGTWSTTGSSLNANHHSHTATLLPSGNVIIVAGASSVGGEGATCDVYDPMMGSWAGTSSMADGRYDFTATLLPSGNVLAAGGGFNISSVRASAELYDTTTGTWATTGSLNTARRSHTATLLPSGKVLVAGGYNNSGTVYASAELYNPASGTWAVTGSMATMRLAHGAVLLTDGRVLVAGGSSSSGAGILASAELYDPATGAWTATGTMTTARRFFTLILLANGKVLAAGGQGGGASAELYDPMTGTWTATGAMTTARQQHTATLLLSGKVLVAGGNPGLTSAELYDPASGTWSSTGSMSGGRYSHVATLLLNGKVLVAGGFVSGPGAINTADVYDPASGIWSRTANMAAPRELASVALLTNGKALVVGGSGSTSAELYDAGLGVDPNWQPLLTAVTASLPAGGALVASGSRFKGVSEAAGGATPTSATNYPLVQLRSLDGGRSSFLLSSTTMSWSDSGFTSQPVNNYPPGYALVTVTTNGIPSVAKITRILSPTFVVNSNGDAPDSDLSDGVCDDGTGNCTLRAALQQANASAGANTIRFAIGSGAQTVAPASALPTISDPVTIDATTQPGFAGSPLIELNGTSAGSGVVGLTIAAGSSTVKGLVINRFNNSAIRIQSNGNNIIQGNYLGTDVPGTAAQGNAGYGVEIVGTAGNLIGGLTAGAGNLISGNVDGVGIAGAAATGNLVQGNFIGTNAAGTAALGNTRGFDIQGGAHDNTIGGTSAAARNLISGNGAQGMIIESAGTTGNVVQGNFIGTQADGVSALGNGTDGVRIHDSAGNTILGGTASGAANTIAFNGGWGVALSGDAGTGNAIRANAIFSNNGLGIDLGRDGVTPNDAGDGDTGANQLQNYPVILAANSSGTSLAIQTTLNSTAQTVFNVDFYASPAADASGYGEGMTYLGSRTVVTEDSGSTSFTATFNVAISAGQFITATATDLAGNSSEFSQARVVADASACASLELVPTAATFSDAGGSGAINIIKAAGCAWTAVSNDAWITNVAPASGTGNGTVTYSVTASTSGCRTGTITVGGRTFTVYQSCPTYAALVSFNATVYDTGTLIEWQSGFEADNLGFRLYRDEAGKRRLVNSQIIAGSALRAGFTSSLAAGDAYAWWEPRPADCGTSVAACAAAYWLEDIDLRGQSSWHGPYYAKPVGGQPPAQSRAALLSQLGNNAASQSRVVERAAGISDPRADQRTRQSSLAEQSAVKITVRGEGWYRVTQPELTAAGLAVGVDPRYLRLFADGQEKPIALTTGQGGAFDESAAIEFYGTGLDTPSTDARVYWLLADKQPGLRVQPLKAGGTPTAARSFTATVERRDRSIYFAALRNGEAENFFGAVVATQPVEQVLTLTHVAESPTPAMIELAMQGVTLAPHRVRVELNGATVYEMSFTGQQHPTARFSVASALLRSGDNSVRLTALGGDADVSLVDFIRVSYAHDFIADDNALKLSATGGEAVTVGGFTSKAIRVFDVTDENVVEELIGEIIQTSKNGFAVSAAPQHGGERTLLIVTDARMRRPASVAANRPSNWRDSSNAANLLILTRGDFMAALDPLKALREAEGYKVAVVDIEDVFDEFSFGSKSPQAVRDLLLTAKLNWKVAPLFLLLAGDASFDARDYLRLGASDRVPTKLVDTQYLETASDDWFCDFNEDGIAEMAVGRLPARSVNELAEMVAKITRTAMVARPPEALLVADANLGYDFERASRDIGALLPEGLRVTQIHRGQLDPATARARLFEAINRGQRLVNYVGHGSANQWRGPLLDGNDVTLMTNADQLPLFVMMSCLNGYFVDVTQDSLAEALMKWPKGGAVAVWASTGMSLPDEQASLNRQLYREMFVTSLRTLPVGEAARRAKAAVADPDVRRTWVLLGDPTMRW